MSQSHLNFIGTPSDPRNPQDEAEEIAKKEKTFREKKREYFDESQFINPADIAKVPGFVPTQKKELDILKAQFRRANEIYLRAHPEIDTLISVFVCKLLEDRPKDVLSYAGSFFEK